MNHINQAPTTWPHNRGELQDVDLYRASARLRLRMSLMRGAVTAIVAYLATALFTLSEKMVQKGPGSVANTKVLLDAFLLDTVVVLEKQVPAIIFPIVGAIGLVIIASVTARTRYEFGKRRYKKELEAHRAQLWEEWKRSVSGVTEDPLQDPDAHEQWIQAKLGQDAIQRHNNLKEIESLFRRDELLIIGVENFITRKKVGIYILSSIIVAVATTVGTRILVLLSQR